MTYHSSESSLLSNVSAWQNESSEEDHQLFFVTSYSDFDKLGQFLESQLLALPLLSMNIRNQINKHYHPYRLFSFTLLGCHHWFQLTVLEVQRLASPSTFIDSTHRMAPWSY